MSGLPESGHGWTIYEYAPYFCLSCIDSRTPLACRKSPRCGRGRCRRTATSNRFANTKLLVVETPRKSSIWPPSGHIFISKIMRGIVFVNGGRMALSLRDVRCDPIANRALNEFMHDYTVAQEKGRLVLTKKTGDMKLFLNDLDDLHQWDFIRNQQMVKEIERLRV